jgi:hypothetical protein
MNKVNPLFVLIVTIIILFISIFYKQQEQQRLSILNEDYKSLEIVAKKFTSMDKSYQNSEHIMKTIENVIGKSNIKNVDITKNKSKIILEIKNSNSRSLNNFVNKVLNEKLNIKKFQLQEDKLLIEVGL